MAQQPFAFFSVHVSVRKHGYLMIDGQHQTGFIRVWGTWQHYIDTARLKPRVFQNHYMTEAFLRKS
eukprot:6472595-Amphidinium_carterae.2